MSRTIICIYHIISTLHHLYLYKHIEHSEKETCNFQLFNSQSLIQFSLFTFFYPLTKTQQSSMEQAKKLYFMTKHENILDSLPDIYYLSPVKGPKRNQKMTVHRWTSETCLLWIFDGHHYDGHICMLWDLSPLHLVRGGCSSSITTA